MEIERRCFETNEIRLEGDSKPKITGYAAKFGVWTDIGGMFREMIAPGAFKKTIKDGDVRGLLNHDANFVLGRNKSGTLSLKEDNVGLRYEILPPDTQWARDLMVSIKRGDINQSSYGFRVVSSDDNYDEDTRLLKEVTLFDVSPVTYPAEASTTSEVRSAFKKTEEQIREAAERDEKIESLYKKLKSGDELSEDEQSLLRSYLPNAEPNESHSTVKPDDVHLPEPVLDHSVRNEPDDVHLLSPTEQILSRFDIILTTKTKGLL